MQKELYAKYRINELDIWLWGEGTATKAYRTFGCHYIPELNAHRFAAWAPNATFVSLVGDFNDWNCFSHPMERIDGGIWLCLMDKVCDGMVYKYCVTDQNGHSILKSDPFAFRSEIGPATGSIVHDINGFTWSDSDYIEKRKSRSAHHSPISVYELHMGTWKKPWHTEHPNYREVADQLAEYCLDMGFTHVELMPITEYPFSGSWGYQVTGYFAPTARYGTAQDFMYFVDKLHSVGIGVILDWVPAHFPRDRHGLSYFDGGPLFEKPETRMAEHPHWGTLVFDYARPEVRSFLVSSALYFFDMYHIDGIRVDAVSSMLYLDYGRNHGEWTPAPDGGNICPAAVGFLRQLNLSVFAEHPGAITVAEESTAFPMVSRPPEHGGLGFSFKWDMGYMHDKLVYMSSDPLFRSSKHRELTFSMDYANNESYILAFSHDEVVHGKGSMIEKMSGDYYNKFASLRALWGFTFAHPGKKLMFMGNEIAQFKEWSDEKQLEWSLLSYPMHSGMQDYIRCLNRLYRQTPSLYERDGGWEGFMWLNCEDYQRSSVAFLRYGNSGKKLVCVANFTPMRYENYTIGLPHSGKLTRIISSDESRFGGSDYMPTTEAWSENKNFFIYEHSVNLTLAPMSACWYEFEEV